MIVGDGEKSGVWGAAKWPGAHQGTECPNNDIGKQRIHAAGRYRSGSGGDIVGKRTLDARIQIGVAAPRHDRVRNPVLDLNFCALGPEVIRVYGCAADSIGNLKWHSQCGQNAAADELDLIGELIMEQREIEFQTAR